jgi:paraquat-inducible protein B
MKQPESLSRRFVLYFNEPVRGLSVGAPVTVVGLPAGEVIDVGLSLDRATMVLRPRVLITFYPERLLARLAASEQAAGKALVARSLPARTDLLRRAVEGGLRAQLQSGNLLTGQLFVALDYFPAAPKPKIDWTRDPLELPVVPSALPGLEAKLSSILAKLDALPLEALGTDLKKDLSTLGQTLEDAHALLDHVDTELVPGLKTTLADANVLLSHVDTELVPGLQTTLADARRALATADRVLENTDASLVGTGAPAQQALRDALQEIGRAAQAIRLLADYLERHPEAVIRGKTEEKP